jgi:hypothetical protein
MTGFGNATWRKSVRSQSNGACVEVARVGDVIGVRDSKDPTGPILTFTPAEFAAFLDGAAKGEFADLV